MAKLDKQGLNTFIRELDKHINTKINKLDISPKADKVMMADGSNVEESVSANKTSIQLALEKSEQAFQRGDEVKTKLVDKLISEGLEVSTNNTFEELIGNIALGKKWASGVSKAINGGKKAKYYPSNATVTVQGAINVDSLNFKPSLIMCTTTTTGDATAHRFSIYSQTIFDTYITQCFNNKSANSLQTNLYNLVCDGTSTFVKDGSFCIPVSMEGYVNSVTWIAFE